MSTFVVAPTDQVAHVSFHSAHPIMNNTPIPQNSKEHYSDMMVNSDVGPEKNLVDQQVYVHENKCMKISAFHSPEDSIEQLIQLALSKTTQINMATAFLMNKKPQSLWSAVSELNRVITHPESGNMFYQIIARYFEKFREIAPAEVGNVIRMEIVKYLLENQNWIKVSKFNMPVNCILHFYLFCKVSSISTISVHYLKCTFIITALDKTMFGCSWDNNIHIHE